MCIVSCADVRGGRLHERRRRCGLVGNRYRHRRSVFALAASANGRRLELILPLHVRLRCGTSGCLRRKGADGLAAAHVDRAAGARARRPGLLLLLLRGRRAVRRLRRRRALTRSRRRRRSSSCCRSVAVLAHSGAGGLVVGRGRVAGGARRGDGLLPLGLLALLVGLLVLQIRVGGRVRVRGARASRSRAARALRLRLRLGRARLRRLLAATAGAAARDRAAVTARSRLVRRRFSDRWRCVRSRVFCRRQKVETRQSYVARECCMLAYISRTPIHDSTVHE